MISVDKINFMPALAVESLAYKSGVSVHDRRQSIILWLIRSLRSSECSSMTSTPGLPPWKTCRIHRCTQQYHREKHQPRHNHTLASLHLHIWKQQAVFVFAEKLQPKVPNQVMEETCLSLGFRPNVTRNNSSLLCSRSPAQVSESTYSYYPKFILLS